MARGVNRVILIGNLGKDPDMRFSPNGNAVANFSIATTEAWKDKTSGEKVEKTEWHRIVAFSRLAEIVGEYLKKGAQVYVEGKLQTRKWQDKETGQDRYSTEVVAESIQMLGRREDSGQAAERPVAAKPSPAGGPTGADFDDDIPF